MNAHDNKLLDVLCDDRVTDPAQAALIQRLRDENERRGAALKPLADKFSVEDSEDEWFPFSCKYAREAAEALTSNKEVTCEKAD